MTIARNASWVAQKLYKRRRVYRELFVGPDEKLTPAAEAVLADLANFCRFSRSTAMTNPITKGLDPHAMALAEGRREVFLRIIGAMNLDLSKLVLMSVDNDNGE